MAASGWLIAQLLLLLIAVSSNIVNCGRPLERRASILQLLKSTDESIASEMNDIQASLTTSRSYYQPPAALSVAAIEDLEERPSIDHRHHHEFIIENLKEGKAGHRCCKGLIFNMLHKVPAGPNPIGNDFRPSKNSVQGVQHRVKRPHYPSPFPN